jgi:hypothetical protein
MHTSYADINALLDTFTAGVTTHFRENLIGIYLTGSLTYNDFVPGRSDIDLLVVLQQAATPTDVERIRQLHAHVAAIYPAWADRVECSYIPAAWLPQTEPPIPPRPYAGNGNFYPEATYGNEWIINTWLLYEYGVALTGPPFRDLRPPVDLADVQAACKRDFIKEWLPKLEQPDGLDDPHVQSYIVLNLCRILSAVVAGQVTSKTPSAAWVRQTYPEWAALVSAAQAWSYGQPMPHADQTRAFIRFTGEQLGIR